MENSQQIKELMQILSEIDSKRNEIFQEIQNIAQIELQKFDQFAPDEKLTISVEKNGNWNDECIKCYNKHIVGIKNAYYFLGEPSLAKDNVIKYIQTEINKEPDFIYFFDTLLGALCTRLNSND